MQPVFSSGPGLRTRLGPVVRTYIGRYVLPGINPDPLHKLRYGSIKVKIMYEICLLIILSAAGVWLPLILLFLLLSFYYLILPLHYWILGRYVPTI